jgi:hypothetical protein
MGVLVVVIMCGDMVMRGADLHVLHGQCHRLNSGWLVVRVSRSEKNVQNRTQRRDRSDSMVRYHTLRNDRISGDAGSVYLNRGHAALGGRRV